MNSNHLKTVTEYHAATKHHFHRYARSMGYLDWATQPEAFRRFEGVGTYFLGLPEAVEGPTWDALFGPTRSPAPVDRDNLSRFFYHSMALSAWKQVVSPEGDVLSRWALRVNPSSGNLHPTEAYLICGAVADFLDEPGVFHYAPDEHLLERRGGWLAGDYEELQKTLPAGAFMVGLSSIHWREAWKYGERAFRYCQHDVGHALAALALSARCLGWEMAVWPGLAHSTMEAVLGTGLQAGPEKEHTDCLVVVTTGGAALDRTTELPHGGELLLDIARRASFTGTPNVLSATHQDWPIIDEVAAACAAEPVIGLAMGTVQPATLPDRGLNATTLIRNRRSAVSMDGTTTLELDGFLRILERLMPDRVAAPFNILGSQGDVSLILFVHKINDLAPGLYCLVRNIEHQASLFSSLRTEFTWRRPEGMPPDLPFFELATGDTMAAAQQLSCNQAIAGEGVFSLGMLARFRDALTENGAGYYPRLFWETGMIGQLLYLEAEAAGLRGTGIGCFFDDAVHRALGIEDDSWQSLYHFTVGGPVDDGRLQTTGVYEHFGG